MEGFSVGPPSIVRTPSSPYIRASPAPLTTARAPQRAREPRCRHSEVRPAVVAAGALALVALGHLLVHVGDVEVRNLSVAREHRGRALGLVGVHVHLQRARVADDQHRVAERLQRRDDRPALRSLPVTAKFVQ